MNQRKLSRLLDTIELWKEYEEDPEALDLYDGMKELAEEGIVTGIEWEEEKERKERRERWKQEDPNWMEKEMKNLMGMSVGTWAVSEKPMYIKDMLLYPGKDESKREEYEQRERKTREEMAKVIHLCESGRDPWYDREDITNLRGQRIVEMRCLRCGETVYRKRLC